MLAESEVRGMRLRWESMARLAVKDRDFDLWRILTIYISAADLILGEVECERASERIPFE